MRALTGSFMTVSTMLVAALALLQPASATERSRTCSDQFQTLVRNSGVDRGPISPGSVPDYFPSTVLRGNLKDRLLEFSSNFSDHVRVITGVKFELNRKRASRELLIISLAGLPKTKKEKLRGEFLRSVSDRTLSFPLGEAGGHLYTRLGQNVVDFFGFWNVQPYALTTSERLEAILDLSNTEFARVRSYVENVNRDPSLILGSRSYNGPEGDFRGTLDKNIPAKGGHNCTSWICTAPIGDNGEKLHQLVGASQRQDVHRNPGWWSSWLAAATPDDRVPMLIYWTNDTIDQALKRRMKNDTFQWDFDRH
jgi:hypothetical protein